jgi:bifunctional UDP-N-acetylglucosamine pyrophosphorylase/glucosamine-1-phosphate N-acetyltransferase
MPRTRTPLAAIVLAAGKGTRMKSSKAKVLHDIAGRPLAFYPILRALEIGASPVVVVVGHQAEAVEAALRAALPEAPLKFAVQEQQLGTAHAVLSAKKALRGWRGPVAILSGDTPLLQAGTLEAVVKARAKARAPLAFAAMTLGAPTGYGRVVRDGAGRAARIVEEKDASPEEKALTEVNAGLYCADAEFLWKALAKVGSQNAQGEFYLTDLVPMAAKVRAPAVVSVPPAEAAGVNDRAELARAARVIADRRNEALMKAGVTIEDPARFDCDGDVELGQDVVIEPGVRLKGRTRIGPGTIVGAGSILVNATVGANVIVKPYTLIEDGMVAEGAILGPFSRLRPGSDVGEGAHVGNFVELKKTRLGKGSKANHLTYLGDATIGAGVNVGCGTITCNYDGEKKHPTVIGDGAFIGSDSILVAPIEIGAGAYTAAGSTITKPVPPGALAVGRARQETKEGWVAARKAAKAAAAKAAASGAGAKAAARRAG